MGEVEERIRSHGLTLPPALSPPPGIVFPFEWVRVHGDRAFIAGHVPVAPDGSLAGPLGMVGTEVSPEDARQSARLVALAMIGSLKRALGDLDRVRAWLRVFAMVNSAPGFHETPRATNGISEIIHQVFGPEIGRHARSSIGMSLPLNAPVACEAEVAIAP